MKFLRGVGIGAVILVLVGAGYGACIGACCFGLHAASPREIAAGVPIGPFNPVRALEGAIGGALAGGALLGLACWSHAKEKTQKLSQQLHSVEIEVRDSGGYSVVE